MEGIFLQILEQSVKGTWVILVVLLARFLLRKAPKWIICGMWSMVGFRLVSFFTVESKWSLIPEVNPIEKQLISTGRISETTIHSLIEEVTMISSRDIGVMGILSYLWLVGLALMLAYGGMKYWELKGKLRTATRYTGGIKQSEYVDSPFILGVIRPVIYIPYDISEEAFSYALAHEQAHIKRLDHIWKLLGFLLLSFYWFQPFVWIAYVIFCRDIEEACDERVIREKDLEYRREYAKVLLEYSVGTGKIAGFSIGFGNIGIKERVVNIMGYKKPSKSIMVFSFAVCLVIALGFLTNPKKELQASIVDENVTSRTQQVIPTGNNNRNTDQGVVHEEIIYDFGDFYAEPRGYEFDGHLLFYVYDIVNNRDTSSVVVEVENKNAEINYYVSNEAKEGDRSVMWAIIYFEDYQDSCEIRLHGKNSKKTYSYEMEVNHEIFEN